MGARSRKRGRTRPAGDPGAAPRAPGEGAAASSPPGRAAKTEAKNAAVRATLEPLAPGERPPWVTYAALFAAALALLNIGLFLAGVQAKGATFSSTVVLGVVLLVAAGGMWRAQYWAVMGFEVLLGVTAAYAAISLLVVTSISGAIRATLALVICGTFFWKLIRAMARIQMPERPQARGRPG